MRIVQLIDSLEAGGAERMAVSYANALCEIVEFSALISTRAEGSLKVDIHSQVDYLHLAKKKTIDYKAVQTLKNYCIDNRVQIIHAHSTSFFLAILVKILLPKVSIIWHNHNGMSHTISKYKIKILRLASNYFSGTIVVNQQLLNWSKEVLKIENAIFLENFAVESRNVGQVQKLEGQKNSRIICLANLREEKNHSMLIEVAEKIILNHKDCTFHLVGKDFNDYYSTLLKEKVREKKLENKIFFYGSQNNIFSLLEQSDIGVLTSNLEGLPVALLEYGLAGLPVVATAVGEIPMVINNGKNGFIVDSRNEEEFYTALVQLISKEELRIKLGKELKRTVSKNYSKHAVIQKYLKWIVEW